MRKRPELFVRGFAPAEGIVALFFVAMTILLVGSLGTQVANFMRAAHQSSASSKRAKPAADLAWVKWNHLLHEETAHMGPGFKQFFDFPPDSHGGDYKFLIMDHHIEDLRLSLNAPKTLRPIDRISTALRPASENTVARAAGPVGKGLKVGRCRRALYKMNRAVSRVGRFLDDTIFGPFPQR